MCLRLAELVLCGVDGSVAPEHMPPALPSRTALDHVRLAAFKTEYYSRRASSPDDAFLWRRLSQPRTPFAASTSRAAGESSDLRCGRSGREELAPASPLPAAYRRALRSPGRPCASWCLTGGPTGIAIIPRERRVEWPVMFLCRHEHPTLAICTSVMRRGSGRLSPERDVATDWHQAPPSAGTWAAIAVRRLSVRNRRSSCSRAG